MTSRILRTPEACRACWARCSRSRRRSFRGGRRRSRRSRFSIRRDRRVRRTRRYRGGPSRGIRILTVHRLLVRIRHRVGIARRPVLGVVGLVDGADESVLGIVVSRRLRGRRRRGRRGCRFCATAVSANANTNSARSAVRSEVLQNRALAPSTSHLHTQLTVFSKMRC